MKNIVIAAVVAVATTSVYAEDHFGQVPLRAEVRASTSIVVTPTALAANLDIDGDAASGPIATVVVKSNDDYEVTLTSDNFEAGDIAGHPWFPLQRSRTRESAEMRAVHPRDHRVQQASTEPHS